MDLARSMFSCRIMSVVTDGVANMVGFRNLVQGQPDMGQMVLYGCAAHHSNLLAKKICQLARYEAILEKTTAVVKYFNTHKLPGGWYKIAGGRQLMIGKAVRWNTYSDHLDSFLKNHTVLSNVCTEYEGNDNLEQSIGIYPTAYKLFH